MSIVPASVKDWQDFNRLAEQQGWDVPDNELSFYPQSLNSYCYALKSADRVQGFVTAVLHGQTAWIGNLIIDPTFRGQGLGGYLFDYILQQLWKAGAVSIWLTASNQGRPLYERRGFELVDEMVRLRVNGTGCKNAIGQLCAAQLETLYQIDCAAWGESRTAMLSHLGRQGRLVQNQTQTALVQFDSLGGIIGPWYAAEGFPAADIRLVEEAQSLFSRETELVCDLRASSVPLAAFAHLGTLTQSENVLMAVGDRNGCSLDSMIALASLGSMG
ncbi:GNAT family N-acetyltransferase [uncultured Desulfuromonas sp.]|uniref:GNAT family N-acetyltransferase n=1 Tax=uncultured Desulfuromonas sp. TaxID=181013 RepID=UPI002AAAE90B|nr:GNAT family N-acetyltransferase [uncultured Desulfuromonas sp.]